MAPLQRFVRRTRIDAPASLVFGYHLRPGAFERLLPPGDGTRVLARSGAIDLDDMRVELSVPVVGPLRQRWVVRHEGYEAGRRFCDVIEQGPFRHWCHEHLVEPIDEASCELVDTIEYALPGGFLGARIGTPITLARLRPMFEHRHLVTEEDVLAIAASPLAPITLRVEAATPSTFATQLAAFLLLAGHDVTSTSIEIVGVDLLPQPAAPDATIRIVDAPRLATTLTAASGRTSIIDEADPVLTPRRILEELASLHGALQLHRNS